MKRFLLLAVSIAALSLISCPPDQGPVNDGKVIDSRLIGDYYVILVRKQYNTSPALSYYIPNNAGDVYKFTKTEVIKWHRNNTTQPYGFVPDTPIRAYTNNGRIYSHADDTLLFDYATNAYPTLLNSDITAANNANNQSQLTNMNDIKTDANAGKIISLKAAGSTEASFFIGSSGQTLQYYSW
jgi:hypothetical protein